MQVCRSLAATVGWLLGAPLAALNAQCEVLKLTGPEPGPNEEFDYGHSLSLSSDRMVIGMPGGPAPGSAHVFERSALGAWISMATLVPSDAEIYDRFGWSVAIDGDTLVACAPADGQLGAKGAAYVFERQPDGAWREVQKLVPPDYAWAYGWAVDLDGDRMVIGAKGASDLSGGQGYAFLYERVGGVWVHKQTFAPTISVPGDGFGAALDLDGDRLVVGASYNWTWPSPGLAFVFERHPSGFFWMQTAVLSPDDLSDVDLFGSSVGLDDERIVVGAPLHSQPSAFVGATYVFERIDGLWTQTAKLTPSDLTYLAEFGWSVGVDGDRVVAGAWADSDVASVAGAAYLFELAPIGWNEVGKFHGSDLGVGDSFGYAMDLDGTALLIGAPSIVPAAVSPGYAFLFDLAPAGPSLIADAAELSLAQGGSQTLHVGACSVHVGDIVVVAGTASGTSSGFALGGVAVPLNLDAYFMQTLGHPGAPPLAGSVGLLDANGYAAASFTVPTGTSSALAGLVLHHAYGVLDSATLALEAVSPAVPVALVP